MKIDYGCELRRVGDARGELIPIEAMRDVPFPIERVYFLRNLLADRPRGFHAHKVLRQAAFCIAGTCNIILDDGVNRTQHKLVEPSKGLLIEPLIWHEMNSFSKDCILMVIASDYYDESDYIRDYNDFLRIRAIP